MPSAAKGKCCSQPESLRVTGVKYVSDPTRVPGDHAQPRHAAIPERPHLSIEVVALSAALGVLVVAIAYTAGRHGYSDSKVADYGYWAGQALIFVPASIRLLTRRGSTEAGTVTAIIGLTVAQYLCKLCYSPLSFTYSDELSHWRTAENILLTGKLFTPNYALPISPQYPGLEEVTTALVQISGLSLFTAGVIVAGVAHLLFAVTLYLLFRNIGRSRRLAGIAVLVYSTNPGLAYFDSLFAYQTLALAFMGVVLVAAWRLTGAAIQRRPDGMGSDRDGRHRRDGSDAPCNQLHPYGDSSSRCGGESARQGSSIGCPIRCSRPLGGHRGRGLASLRESADC